MLSAVLFSRGRLTWLRELWREGRLVPLSSHATVAELLRVLAYPKFGLSNEEIQILLSTYLPYSEVATVNDSSSPHLPSCSDEADQMFLVLAAVAKTEVLVTGDKALLELAGRTPFAIETPARFKTRFS